MLNIRSLGFEHEQYWIAWYMVEFVNQIKFTKQTVNVFPKIFNFYKSQFKTLSNMEMELFTGFRGKLRILTNVRQIFMQIQSKTKYSSLFLQKSPFCMIEKVLNMLQNWLPKVRTFNFQINLTIKSNRTLKSSRTLKWLR